MKFGYGYGYSEREPAEKNETQKMTYSQKD